MDWVGKRVYLLPNKKIISLGYPRCDGYFDQELVRRRFAEKPIAHSLVPEFGDASRVIFFTPTWRPYEYRFPLEVMTDDRMELLNEWLASHDLYLFYTVHSAGVPNGEMKSFDRIIYIDTDAHPLFDTNEFMLEVDLLSNDYSTTSTEFSLLRRPQVFYMPDYDFYASEKGFVEEYRDLLTGREVMDFQQFKQVAEEALADPDGYVARFEPKRRELLEKYYDSEAGDSAERFYRFIRDLMEN